MNFGDNNVSGSFDDLFTFGLAQNSRVSISITNAYSDQTQVISNFTLSLYNGSMGAGSAIDSAMATSTPSPVNPAGGSQFGGIFDHLSFGGYSFRVTGTTNGDSPSYGGSISISVSAVPLPASAPMFGAALLALAGFSYGMNRWVAPNGKAPAQAV